MVGRKVAETAEVIKYGRKKRSILNRREDNMITITEELKQAISEIKPAMVATASKKGQPNVSPKGSLRVLDDKHLVFVDLRSPQTVKNLKENPYLCIMGLNAETRKGWRVWGKVDEILTSGALFDKLSKEYLNRNMGKVNHVVKVTVEKQVVF